MLMGTKEQIACARRWHKAVPHQIKHPLAQPLQQGDAPCKRFSEVELATHRCISDCRDLLADASVFSNQLDDFLREEGRVDVADQ